MYIVVPFGTEKRFTFALSVLIGRTQQGPPTRESLVPGLVLAPAGS